MQGVGYNVDMTMIPVAVSGTVGKQIFPTPVNASAGALLPGVTFNTKAMIDGILLTPSGANATLTIRDGNASGEVVFFGRATSAYGTKDFDSFEHVFTKGMHVKVIGTNAVAYLNIE